MRAAGVPEATLDKLAYADAFRSLALDRRQALWQVARQDTPVGIYQGQLTEDAAGQNVELPGMTTAEHVVHDYGATSLSLKAHPVQFVREKLQLLQVLSLAELDNAVDGQPVKVAGLVLVRQRPGTAGGICFMTIEDETGQANLVLFPTLFDRYRKEILHSKLIRVEGKLQRSGEVIHVVAQHCYDLTKLLRHLTQPADDTPPADTASATDEKGVPAFRAPNKRTPVGTQEIVFPEARNFK